MMKSCIKIHAISYTWILVSVCCEWEWTLQWQIECQLGQPETIPVNNVSQLLHKIQWERSKGAPESQKFHPHSILVSQHLSKRTQCRAGSMALLPQDQRDLQQWHHMALDLSVIPLWRKQCPDRWVEITFVEEILSCKANLASLITSFKRSLANASEFTSKCCLQNLTTSCV